MPYRQLGKTDLKVSEIGLGTMTFGEQNSTGEGHQQLDMALDHGVNFIDTAEMYSIPPRAETYGATEQIIDSWLHKTGKRVQVILSSKVVGKSNWLPHIREAKALSGHEKYTSGGRRKFTLPTDGLSGSLSGPLAGLKNQFFWSIGISS